LTDRSWKISFLLSIIITVRRTINLYRYKCDICNGCGKCVGAKSDMSVVTASRLQSPTFSLKNPDNRRLVTADIGTTTIAMKLYDSNGQVVDEYAVVNPQTVFGADVISRIQAAANKEYAKAMKDKVEDALAKGFKHFEKRLSKLYGDGEESLFCVLAANTIMVYLLMGYDTSELGHAPFRATHLESIRTEIKGVDTFVFPGMSAFVGGDIVSGIYACEMTKTDAVTLFIDLGTNGEMALGSKDRIIVSATAAGPAFEGGVNKGVWGSDMVAFLSELKRRNIMDETGLLKDEYFEKGITIGNVTVTQASIRAVQLAKAAIAAGCRILMKEYGAEYSDIDRVVLAGGFGYYLSPSCAADIGLIPMELKDRSVSGGNTSLLGAYRLGARLMTKGGNIPAGEGRTYTASDILNTDIKVINLAEKSEFNEIYMNEMNF
jgi:uncharacterized 2Fe-2S/4Fe-4S cluster protein (DUF4445 family)